MKRNMQTHLAGEEEKNVSLRLGEVDLHHGDECGIHVIGLGRAAVQDLHGIGAPRNREDGAAEEVG